MILESVDIRKLKISFSCFVVVVQKNKKKKQIASPKSICKGKFVEMIVFEMKTIRRITKTQ